MQKAFEKIAAGWWLALLLLLGANPAAAQRPLKTAETVPGGERWLSPGDQLQVRLTGEPGGQASFLNGRPLLELPAEQASGQRGIYQGSYTITATDTLGGAAGRPLWLHLRLPDGRHDSLATAAPVRVLNPDQPQLAITKGGLAYLNYGLGENRLGGAKLGYLDSLVVLHVVGRAAGQYRVQLAAGQQAWVPAEVVRLLPPGGFAPASLPARGACRATRSTITCACRSASACPTARSCLKTPPGW